MKWILVISILNPSVPWIGRESQEIPGWTTEILCNEAGEKLKLEHVQKGLLYKCWLEEKPLVLPTPQ